MSKNKIIIVLSIILIISIILNIITIGFKNNNFITEIKEGNIDEYQNMLDGYIPENGYVPDAKTAIKIAKAIFETLDMEGGEYIVEYDENKQLWIVINASIIGDDGYVIIQRKDGMIVRAWKSK